MVLKMSKIKKRQVKYRSNLNLKSTLRKISPVAKISAGYVGDHFLFLRSVHVYGSLDSPPMADVLKYICCKLQARMLNKYIFAQV